MRVDHRLKSNRETSLIRPSTVLPTSILPHGKQAGTEGARRMGARALPFSPATFIVISNGGEFTGMRGVP